MAETTSDKLQGILNSKEAIRQAIKYKGVSCEKTVPLSHYANKIKSISSGGGLGLKIPGTVYKYTVGMYSGTPLRIITQPSNFAGTVDKKAFFVVAAIGEKLTYQWQQCRAGTDTWSNVNYNGNTSILAVTITQAGNGQKYRCVITNSNGDSVTSDIGIMLIK